MQVYLYLFQTMLLWSCTLIKKERKMTETTAYSMLIDSKLLKAIKDAAKKDKRTTKAFIEIVMAKEIKFKG